MLHQVPVVRDHVERDRVVADPGARRAGVLPGAFCALHDQRELPVTGETRAENPEAVLPRSDVQERGVPEVDEHPIAQHAVLLERVVPELPFVVPALVTDDEVDVVVPVSPRERRAAGESEVDAVIDRLVAAIDRAVVVHHRGHALEDVVRGEVEHVIVEPVAAGHLAPVTAHVHDPAVVGGVAGARVRSVGVDGVVPGDDHRPVVVVELAGEVEGARVTIALGCVVPVVFVGRDAMHPEAPVRRHVDRQPVVMPKQDRLPDSRLDHLERERPVEGPDSVGSLDRHPGVDARLQTLCRALERRESQVVLTDLVVEPAGAELAEAAGPVGVSVPLCTVSQPGVLTDAGGDRRDHLLREELVPALMGPALPGGAALRRRGGQGPAQVLLDQRLPRVLVDVVGLEGRLGPERLLDEVVQHGVRSRRLDVPTEVLAGARGHGELGVGP